MLGYQTRADWPESVTAGGGRGASGLGTCREIGAFLFDGPRPPHDRELFAIQTDARGLFEFEFRRLRMDSVSLFLVGLPGGGPRRHCAIVGKRGRGSVGRVWVGGGACPPPAPGPEMIFW